MFSIRRAADRHRGDVLPRQAAVGQQGLRRGDQLGDVHQGETAELRARESAEQVAQDPLTPRRADANFDRAALAVVAVVQGNVQSQQAQVQGTQNQIQDLAVALADVAAAALSGP